MTGVLLSKNRDTLSPIELTLILIGASIQAFTYASSNNLRFAVAYFCTKEFLPKATALVLFGGVISSLLGPLLSNVTRHMLPADYAGNFLQITFMYLFFGLLSLLADFEPPKQKAQSNKNDEDDVLSETLNMILADEGRSSIEDDEDDARSETDKKAITTDRTLSEILFDTELILLTCFQCLSYNIMSLYMTQVQLPMIVLGYSADARTYTITAHMIGMFLPGLISGHIINAIGTWTTTLLGFIVFLVGGGIMLVNGSLAMFIVGMTMIGVGWNLTFVGPSSEISRICYTQEEKTKVVGFNDGIMLATIGIFSLTGSLIYQAIGSWKMYNVLLMIVSGISALIAAWREVKYRLQPLIEANSRAFSASLSFDQQLLDQL
jgi:MFS family permease